MKMHHEKSAQNEWRERPASAGGAKGQEKGKNKEWHANHAWIVGLPPRPHHSIARNKRLQLIQYFNKVYNLLSNSYVYSPVSSILTALADVLAKAFSESLIRNIHIVWFILFHFKTVWDFKTYHFYSWVYWMKLNWPAILKNKNIFHCWDYITKIQLKETMNRT